MTKIKITALTDKANDDEILAKLKKIGVKIKDTTKEETGQEEVKGQISASGDTLIEKRVASTIIRRRVHTPPPPEKEELKEEKKDLSEEKKRPHCQTGNSEKKGRREGRGHKSEGIT